MPNTFQFVSECGLIAAGPPNHLVDEAGGGLGVAQRHGRDAAASGSGDSSAAASSVPRVG